MKPGDESIPTRQSLLNRLKNCDDHESWSEFFNTYWRLIYSVALKAGLTETEAQEVVQETVIRVSKSMPEFTYNPEAGSFKAWLLNLTRWRITDQLRKRRREQSASWDQEKMEELVDPRGLHLERVWDEEWEKNVMETALQRVKAQVSPKQYQIFDLYVLKKWPVPKVASLLGVSPGQVYMARHRISRLVKAEVKKIQDQNG